MTGPIDGPGSSIQWFRNVLTLGERVIYRLQPKQNSCFSLTPLDLPPEVDYAKHIGYGGAAGGGKSHLARAVGTVAMFKWPGCTGIIFRRTKQEVKDNHIVKYLQEVPRKLPDGRTLYNYNGEDMCATFEELGSRLYFGYLKEFSDVDRYQGLEFDFMIFEEATHQHWETVRWLTGNRLRATVDVARPFVLYPSNPGNVGHFWYKRLFIERKYNPELEEFPEDYTFVQAKLDDNKVLTERDPTYIKELNTLPEPYRSWLRDGDWEAGLGLALTMLRREVHFLPPFNPPDHWVMYGGFDWGYEHPWSFGWYTVNEDKQIIKGDTIQGRHQMPHEIIASIKTRMERSGVDWRRLKFIEAGHDCWADKKARGENVPTIAETFAQAGMGLKQANISRVSGLNNLRLYLSYEGLGEDGEDIVPALRFMRTDGNEKCMHQLEAMPTDPDKPEDALKSDADIFGQGGDDMYDETRYAVASRPPPARSRFLGTKLEAWSPEILALEAEKNSRGRLPKGHNQPRYLHPEFGDVV
jgi:hypothetical protein